MLPGLVNTHTHAAMSLFRGIADDLPLMDWLTKFIFPAEAKNVSPAFVKAGTTLACLEMIRGGTTTFADMYYFESDVAEAVNECGLRGVLGETWLDFPVPDHKDLAESQKVTRAFLEKWKGHPRVVAAVAPHAPYTNGKESLQAAQGARGRVSRAAPHPPLRDEGRAEADRGEVRDDAGEMARRDRLPRPERPRGPLRLVRRGRLPAPRRAQGRRRAQPRVEHEARFRHR